MAAPAEIAHNSNSLFDVAQNLISSNERYLQTARILGGAEPVPCHDLMLETNDGHRFRIRHIILETGEAYSISLFSSKSGHGPFEQRITFDTSGNTYIDSTDRFPSPAGLLPQPEQSAPFGIQALGGQPIIKLYDPEMPDKRLLDNTATNQLSNELRSTHILDPAALYQRVT